MDNQEKTLSLVPGRSYSMLVVEDDEDVRLMLEELLLQKGHRVMTAKDGQEAITTIQHDDIDVVITDIRMPRLDGIKLAEWIKLEHSNIDVIIITGNASLDTALASIRLSAFDYLLKPFPDIQVVGETIERALTKRRLEEALRQKTDELLASQQSFSSIVEMTADGIVVNDQDGNIFYANSAAKKFFAKGSGKFKIQTSELPPLRLNNRTAEVEILRQNREFGTAELRIDETTWQGKPANLIVVRDITERKIMQAQIAQSDRLASLGVLAAGIAHEINNPLTYMLYNLERLTEQLPLLPVDCEPSRSNLEQYASWARETFSGARRIHEIIKCLKAFSHTENDVRGPVDVNSVLENALIIVHNDLRHRARLVKNLGQVSPVTANEGRLVQVFLNLLINAVQAIENGDAEHNEICVRTCQLDQEVFIEIRDTGKGIPAEHFSRLFDPFFTTKEVGVGTGLGLYICSNIISSYNGKIDFWSEIGKGALFCIRLPAAASTETKIEVSAMKQQEIEPPAIHARLLVIEDDPTVTVVIESMLEDEHEVVCAPSGLKALEILEQDAAFDLILCDFMMPYMNGMEFYEWLKEAHPELKQRLAFITGGAFTQKGQELLNNFPNTVIEKPFDYKTLRKKVRELLNSFKVKD